MVLADQVIPQKESKMEELHVNPQMALTSTGVLSNHKSPLHCHQGAGTNPRIAIVIYDCTVKARAVSAVANPASSCFVDTLVVLKPPPTETTDRDASAREWLRRHRVDHAERVNVFYGEEGFQEMLLNKTASRCSIDIVYLTLQANNSQCQRNFARLALEARKHVLLHDLYSTSYEEFSEQLACARKINRFINFSTMFVHHHRVTNFLGVVTAAEFGNIESIDARLTVNFDDVEKVGLSLPLQTGDGCLRILARYCILLSILLLARTGSHPVSAQVNDFKKFSMVRTSSSSSCSTESENEEEEPRGESRGEPLCADCVVTFSGNQILTFHVGYSTAPTRQVLEVRARDRFATVQDFAIPHPDELSTYRIYDKERCPQTGKLEVVRGEALDAPSGPPQAVMMWRCFGQLCRTVERQGWNIANNQTEFSKPFATQHQELTNVALQTKIVLQALHDSIKNGCSKLSLDMKDCCTD